MDAGSGSSGLAPAQLAGQTARGRLGLHGQDGVTEQLGDGQRIGELLVRQPTGPLAVQAQAAQTRRANPEREREHGPNAAPHGPIGERRRAPR